MRVILQPGDVLVIGFHETDGEFQVHYDSKIHPKQIVVMETAGIPGNALGNALQIFYIEDFSKTAEELFLEKRAPDQV